MTAYGGRSVHSHYSELASHEIPSVLCECVGEEGGTYVHVAITKGVLVPLGCTQYCMRCFGVFLRSKSCFKGALCVNPLLCVFGVQYTLVIWFIDAGCKCI